MSPELFDPGEFGLKDGRQTKRSDCHALGMVIYEVLSGQAPFLDTTATLLLAGSSRVNVLGDPEESRGCGSQMLSGVSWSIAGSPARVTGRASKKYPSLWRRFRGLGRRLPPEG